MPAITRYRSAQSCQSVQIHAALIVCLLLHGSTSFISKQAATSTGIIWNLHDIQTPSTLFTGCHTRGCTKISNVLLSTKISEVLEQAPQSPMFELRQIPGKGFGAIALRDIMPGELLIEEKPLFSINKFALSESFAKTVENEVDKLSEDDRKRVYALHGFIGHTDDIDNSPSDPNNDDIIILDAPALKINKNLKMEIPPIHIYRTNATPMGPGASGLFPLISRLNSQCTPNVHYNWNEKREISTIHCVSKITAGEEIAHCYTGMYLPRLERMKYLWGNFGFPCSCKACSLSGVQREESDDRRSRLESLEEMSSRAIFEKEKEFALHFINMRLELLAEEGLDNAATMYKCEYDAFLAVTCAMSICSSTEEGNGEMLDLSALDSTEKEEARGWLEKAYKHVVQAKGAESLEAHKCFYYLSIM